MAALLVGAAARGRAEAPPARAIPAAAAHLAQPDTVFRHGDHGRYACTRCHSGGERHRDLLVRTVADCRACHHAAPVAEPCAGCHDDEARSERLFAALRTMTLPLGRTATRPLPFQHARHEGIACASCHADTPARSAQSAACAGCHVEHHSEGADCAACHERPTAADHPLAVHAGCTGAACHADAPFAETPRSRAFCLSCHQDQAEHRPGADCASCHVLPPPVPGAAGHAGLGFGR